MTALRGQVSGTSPRTALGLALFGLLVVSGWAQPSALVLQSDFGLKDGAVAAMKGVAARVDLRVPVHDLTHEITPYDIWEAAYRLKQTASYWPAGTVFVSVVDPGVGTDRLSVVLKAKSGHFFVSPDNGTLTLVAEDLGIAAVRQIDETRNRLSGSDKSYTFHGRDEYAYTGARLASGAITFEEVGPERAPEVVRIDYPRPVEEAGRIRGGIPVLDPNYGNVWTNIPEEMLARVGMKPGDRVRVTLAERGIVHFTGEVPYVSTFGEVPPGAPLLYLNSLLNAALALNQENFAQRHGVRAGADWTILLQPLSHE